MMAGMQAVWPLLGVTCVSLWWGLGLARWAQEYDWQLRAGAPASAATLWLAAFHARRQPLRWRRDAAGGLAAGALGVGVWCLQGGAGMGFVLLGLGLMALAYLDGHSGLLPDALTLPLMGVGWGLGRPDIWTAMADSLSIWAGLATAAWLYRLVRGRDGFGGGDVKCLAMLAAWLGAAAALLILWVGSLLGLLVWAFGRRQRQAYPFGPCLALAAAPWLLWPDGVARLLM